MSTLAVALATAPLSTLRPLCDIPGERPVRAVFVVEDLGQLATTGTAGNDAVAILTASASEQLWDYRGDVAMRQAASARLSALVLTGSDVLQTLPQTSVRLAIRSGLGVLSAPERLDVAAVVLAFGEAVSGPADLAMRQIDDTFTMIAEWSVDNSRPVEIDQIVDRAEQILGGSIRWAPSTEPGAEFEDGDLWSAVLVDDEIVGALRAAPATGHHRIAVQASLAMLAGELSLRLQAAQHALQAPVRSRGSVIADLLRSRGPRRDSLIDTARSLGLPIEGSHLALRIEFDHTSGPTDPEHAEVQRYELLQAAGRVAYAAARAEDPDWHLALVERSLLLIRIRSGDPSRGEMQRAKQVAERVLAVLGEQFPQAPVFGGLGSAHQGVEGLRASSAEALTAVTTARAGERTGRLAVYDAVGLQRMLLEWYTTDAARDSVRDLLAPLDALGARQSAEAVQTLRLFLEEQGSVTRVAQRLHMHRNGVAYRMRHIAEVLEVDLEDPDQRLALQLACRARLLG